MNDEAEEIKRRIDIVEFIGSYVTLKKAGANHKGLCPFHSEKTPSMMVSSEKQIFKCFGCNEGGDIFSFLMKIEGLGFGDALKTLADRAGVKLKREHFERLKTGEQPGQKTRLFQLNELAAKLYHKILTDHPQAKIAREYLEARGINQKTISEFNLGYAPKSWDLLIRFAESRGFSEKELILAGLAVRKDRQTTAGERNSYDRFRERIVFPIDNVLGNPVAFTGRLLADSDNAPKYLNSSESPVYHKSLIIYGLDKAKLKIKELDLAVIVEGNMDVIACHQAGFQNVVAVSGTSLTREMLVALSRYTNDIAFSFDNDSAGKMAARRAITLAGELELNAKIINLPGKYKDPDEAIKADPKNWQEAIATARPVLEDLIKKSVTEKMEIADKKRAVKEILPLIKTLKSKTESDHYIKMLSQALLISEGTLRDDLKRAKVESSNKKEAVVGEAKKTTDSDILLAICAGKSDLSDSLIKDLPEILLADGILGEEIGEIQKNPKNIKKDLEKIAKLSAVKEILLVFEKDFDTPEEIESFILDLKKKLQVAVYEKKKSRLIEQIAEADSRGDKKLRLTLLKELNSVIINGRE
jgi:DNA primase